MAVWNNECGLQDCFKSSWKIHKVVHQKPSRGKWPKLSYLHQSLPLFLSYIGSVNSHYNPWPSFQFTGPLRPAPLVSLIISRDYHVTCFIDTKESCPGSHSPARLCRRRWVFDNVWASHCLLILLHWCLGIPHSEREAKRASVITQLPPEEIEGLKVACRVSLVRPLSLPSLFSFFSSFYS